MNRKHIIRNLRSKGIDFDPNLSTKELNDLLNQSSVFNKISRTTNFTSGRGNIQVSYNATKTDEPVQVTVCEDIGKDAWTGEGFCLTDLQSALDGVDRNRALEFLIDSPGGYVNAGKSIRNWLSNWGGIINQTIIGVAASTASWMIPADKTRAYKNSQFFMHRAMAAPIGNVDDLQEAIIQLNKTDGQIADMYADQAESDPTEMLDLMKGANGQGTLLTGKEALAAGLVDELIDGEAKNNFSADWLNSARQKLSARNSLSALPTQGERDKQTNNPQENKMKEKIALLNKRGITPPANATESQLDELINQSNLARKTHCAVLNKWKVTHDAENMTDLQLAELVEAGKPAATATSTNGLSDEDKQTLATLRNQVTENRRKEIRNRLETLASEGRITINQIPDWEAEAIAATDTTAGNPILNALGKNPVVLPGIAPLNDFVPSGIEAGNASFADVQKHVLANGPGFRNQFLGKNAGNIKITDRVRQEFGQRAIAVANAIAKNKKAIIEMWNSNSIDSALQRAVILQDMLEAYALRLIVLQAFSVKYENIPLEGTDQVVVPYFPLQTNASVQFVKGTGYTTANDWTENSRSITIGGDGDSATSGANATAGTAKDRLYQRIDFTSYDMRRQPYLNVAELCKQAADKLGVDVLTQIISRVVVTGNFGAAVKTVSAALFTPDDVADLSEYADTAQWPEMARSMVLKNTYKTPLLKDNTFKQYLSYGATDPIRKAQIQEAYGFENMYFIPTLDTYTAANVVGWINHKSAVLCGFAPIMPAEGVRALLSAYEVIVNPASGAVLEYRKMANATTDTEQEIFQSCFGSGKGVDAALKIIKTT